MSKTKDNETIVKERPILFSAPMVRAILKGAKTQTRRVVKPSPVASVNKVDVIPRPNGPKTAALFHTVNQFGHHEDTDLTAFCPYGMPGNRLWVRETFYCDHYAYPDGERDGITLKKNTDGTWRHLTLEEKRADMLEEMYYRADGEPDFEDPTPITWKPSIHMPRWASRITLEIADVRVERLQDISEADAAAEGVRPLADTTGPNKYTISTGDCSFNDPTAKGCFEMLWNAINGPDSWTANPWVWVVEFEVVK